MKTCEKCLRDYDESECPDCKFDSEQDSPKQNPPKVKPEVKVKGRGR